MYPTLTLETTAEKFRILDNNNPASCESEDDAVAATDPLTHDDCTESDDECNIYCSRTECDNTVAIKSKLTTLKK